MAGRENYAWAKTNFERSGSMRVRRKAIYTSVSEGRTILISLGELRFIDQRCQLGLKLMLCRERCTMPFYQRLSRDFRYQAPPLFSRALKRSGRPGTRLSILYHSSAVSLDRGHDLYNGIHTCGIITVNHEMASNSSL